MWMICSNYIISKPTAIAKSICAMTIHITKTTNNRFECKKKKSVSDSPSTISILSDTQDATSISHQQILSITSIITIRTRHNRFQHKSRGVVSYHVFTFLDFIRITITLRSHNNASTTSPQIQTDRQFAHIIIKSINRHSTSSAALQQLSANTIDSYLSQHKFNSCSFCSYYMHIFSHTRKMPHWNEMCLTPSWSRSTSQYLDQCCQLHFF